MSSYSNHNRKRGWIDNKVKSKRTQRPAVSKGAGSSSNGGNADENTNLVCTRKASTTPSNSVIGNESSWNNFCDWLNDEKHIHKSCLVMGNSGVGKTSGVNHFTRKAGFVHVELSSSDIRGTTQFKEDLREAISRKSLVGKIALVVEDIDGLEEEYLAILKGFIKSPGTNANPLICTSSNVLPMSFLDVKKCMHCIYVKPPEYSAIFSYGRLHWPHLPHKTLSTNAHNCRGDMRQFRYLNEMDLKQVAQNKDVQDDKFTLAQKLLYSDECNIQIAQDAITTHGNFMCNAIFENYLYAIQSGRILSMDRCSTHASTFSDADMMRCGEIFYMLEESKLLWGTAAFSSGQKKKNPSATLHFPAKLQKKTYLTELERRINTEGYKS